MQGLSGSIARSIARRIRCLKPSGALKNNTEKNRGGFFRATIYCTKRSISPIAGSFCVCPRKASSRSHEESKGGYHPTNKEFLVGRQFAPRLKLHLILIHRPSLPLLKTAATPSGAYPLMLLRPCARARGLRDIGYFNEHLWLSAISWHSSRAAPSRGPATSEWMVIPGHVVPSLSSLVTRFVEIHREIDVLAEPARDRPTVHAGSTGSLNLVITAGDVSDDYLLPACCVTGPTHD